MGDVACQRVESTGHTDERASVAAAIVAEPTPQFFRAGSGRSAPASCQRAPVPSRAAGGRVSWPPMAIRGGTRPPGDPRAALTRFARDGPGLKDRHYRTLETGRSEI